MQINFSPLKINSFKQENSYRKYQNLSPLSCDTVSFGAMKKKQFTGIDLVVVNAFKAPIEKFNSNDDFQNWCLDKINEIKEKEYSGRKEETALSRKKLLEEWMETIEKHNYSNAEALLILDGITRDLKQDNDNMPPVLSKSALQKAMDWIQGSSSGTSVNFNKTYRRQVQNEYTKGQNTGWIIIKGKKSDPEHFEENINKLKALSYKTWCTTGDKAESHLNHGDIHIYIEDGKTKLSLAAKDNEVEEIQGELNNWIIPFEYIDEIKRHIEECSLSTSKKSRTEIENTQKAKIELEKSKIILKDAIENNDAEKIFEYFGIETTRRDDGLLVISEFKQPDLGFTYSDLGIDENKLLEQVAAVGGDVKMYGSKATSLGNIEYITGNADLQYAPIKTLNKLRATGGNLDLRFSSVQDLGDLMFIGRDFYNGGCPLTSLGKLNDIGRNADFRGGKITDYGNLAHIGLNTFVPEDISDEDYEYLSRITECGVYYY